MTAAFYKLNLVLVALTCALFDGVHTFSAGAPDFACDNMVPTGHGVAPLDTEPPYVLIVDKDWYAPGETITGECQCFIISCIFKFNMVL